MSDADSVRYVALSLERCAWVRAGLAWGWGQLLRLPSGELYVHCIACGVTRQDAVEYVRELNATPEGKPPPPPPNPFIQ